MAVMVSATPSATSWGYGEVARQKILACSYCRRWLGDLKAALATTTPATA